MHKIINYLMGAAMEIASQLPMAFTSVLSDTVSDKS